MRAPEERAHFAIQAALADRSNVDLSWLNRLHASNEWTMAMDVLQFLTSLVSHLKPQHIIEFGSGLSTLVLARACSKYSPSCRITSVDHDPKFRQIGIRQFLNRNIDCFVKLQLAPLVARECVGSWVPMYFLRPKRFASAKPAELIVIDGPPAVLGGREGTLYQALDFVKPGTILLLDDANRSKEKEALFKWQEILGEAIDTTVLSGFARGLAAIVIHEVVPKEDLSAYRTRRTVENIKQVIPAGQTFILVDDSQSLTGDLEDRRCIPFLERNGQYWGPPPDDATAVSELERLRRCGAGFIVFGWPAFWWLDYYVGLSRHLRSEFRCLAENERLVAFDLR